jgi:hypothetical protein
MTKHTATPEMLDKLYLAQLVHAQAMIGETLTSKYGMTDDGFDYLTSALALAERMTRFRFDEGLEAFQEFLNDENDGLRSYACDGVAEAFEPYMPADDED